MVGSKGTQTGVVDLGIIADKMHPTFIFKYCNRVL